MRQPFHQQNVRASLRESHDSPFAILAHNGVHLPVAEHGAVSLCGPFVYTYTSGDILHFCSAVGATMTVVFHLMTAMRGEVPAFVGTDVAIYEFVRYTLSAPFHIGRYLFR